MRLSANARSEILSYPWPGNVRELQNSLRRAIVTSGQDQVEIDISTPRNFAATRPIAHEPAQAAPPQLKEENPQQLTQDTCWEGMTLAEVERVVIEAAINRNQGNITRAARELEVNPSTIYRKLEKWAGSS